MELDRLPFGMNAPVGAAGGFMQDCFAGDSMDGLGHRFLDAGACFRFLPSEIGGAVVRKKGFERGQL